VSRLSTRRAITLSLSALLALTLACTACGSSGDKPHESAASSRDISFVVDGSKTYGTLEIPAHHNGQRLAAALLIPGSGPNDRNGNDPGLNVSPDTLKLMANALAKQGIITLRYDKYFSGKTGTGAFTKDPASITLNTFIRQADAAYNFMGRQPEADSSKLLVVGHSEGGMYALEVANSVTPRPAGLALVEPQDEHLLDLLQLQENEGLNAAAAKGQISQATAVDNATAVKQAIAAFRAGQPISTDGVLPGIAQTLESMLTGTNAPGVRSDDAVYPPDLAAKLQKGTRVLVTDSTGDTNIPLSTIGPLVQALQQAGTTGPGLQKLTGLDHFLHPAGTSTNTAMLDQSFLTALHDWAQPYAH
jgi:uncharacterized protein